MITKITSVNCISGQRYRNKKIEDTIYDILKSISGLKGFKMYLDESYTLLPMLNIVIMVDKDFELVNTLDNSLITVSKEMEEEFRFTKEKMFLFIIWK